MKIAADSVVTFHYRLQNAETGEELETTHGEEPLAYLHGHQNMIAGLEAELSGHEAGDEFIVTLEPEDAYGARREVPLQRIPIKHLQGAKRWRPGMVAWVETEHQRQQVTVVKVGKFNADCDINHPLAGKRLTFEIKVESVRAAAAEELAHGHAHGVGGHHQ